MQDRCMRVQMSGEIKIRASLRFVLHESDAETKCLRDVCVCVYMYACMYVCV